MVSLLGSFQQTAHHLLAVHLLLGCCAVWQVRKFANEQYAATGLTMHPLHTPVEVKKQDNGKLTIVIADKEGNKTEITDNDQVWHETDTSCPATACSVCCVCWGGVVCVHVRLVLRQTVLTLSSSHATSEWRCAALQAWTDWSHARLVHVLGIVVWMSPQVMMATGRVPKIQGLGLEEVGVKLGEGARAGPARMAGPLPAAQQVCKLWLLPQQHRMQVRVPCAQSELHTTGRAPLCCCLCCRQAWRDRCQRVQPNIHPQHMGSG